MHAKTFFPRLIMRAFRWMNGLSVDSKHSAIFLRDKKFLLLPQIFFFTFHEQGLNTLDVSTFNFSSF